MPNRKQMNIWQWSCLLFPSEHELPETLNNGTQDVALVAHSLAFHKDGGREGEVRGQGKKSQTKGIATPTPL
eukprot:3976778-Amphidinium_carterae.3